jgi:hypothetical protein
MLPRPAASTICMGSAHWRLNVRHRGSALPARAYWVPNCCARAAASAELSPRCPSGMEDLAGGERMPRELLRFRGDHRAWLR